MYTAQEKTKMFQAMRTRDHRFDGRFFIGVRTTKIYCRPVCPAKPKPENVEFFQTAWQAEHAGYRPCLRCRPESAPFSPAWLGTSAVVKRALKRLGDGALFHKNEEEFAEMFGMTARHLRRLFVEELGITPKQFSDRLRLDFARSLLYDTCLPMTKVAYASGFESLRRFNASFKQAFTRPPGEIRRTKPSVDNLAGTVKLYLNYRPPFDWQSILSYLSSHANFSCEEISATSYSRYVLLPDSQKIAHVKISDQPTRNRLQLEMRGIPASQLYAVTRKIRRMFDLDLDSIRLREIFKESKLLTDLSDRYQGSRLVTGWDPFEVCINTILGQLVSISHARLLNRQLIEHYGIRAIDPRSGWEICFFPQPATISASDLMEIKTTGKRRDTLRLFSRSMMEGDISFDTLQDQDHVRRQLLAIKGVGPWTAEYILLRGLGDTDAFPEKDLILGRMLQRHPELKAADFSPWRSYIAIVLWRWYFDLGKP